jgi:catechol 2,3-dioxygenase-like lactoylglutathione lyase family enzyme
MFIDQLILETARPGELKKFYQELLGLPLESRKDGSMEITAGRSTLVFNQVSEGQPCYHFAFNIPANSIEECRAWCIQKMELMWMDDYKSDIADFVNWHAKSVYFFDPAGNIVECIARMDLDNNSSAAFSASHFLSISEVGIVLPGENFDQQVEEFLKKYQLSYFPKQPPLPQFRAIGDDEGLFIVVPAHRNWYPTSSPAGIFPMQVKFSEPGKEMEYSC